MDDVLGFLVSNPVVCVPLLLLTSFLLFAILKRLLKMAAVLAIAGGLYVLLVEYVRTAP